MKVLIAKAAVDTIAQLMSENEEAHDPPGMHTVSQSADHNSAELPAGRNLGAGKSSQPIRAYETL